MSVRRSSPPVRAARPVDMVSDHHHRNVRGGAARAAVFGISDGLVTNVSLILGVAGANASGPAVRLAGLALLIAGAFSMASGEYVSMRAQAELLERELDMERTEIARRPEYERRELVQLYRSRGIDEDLAEELATEMHRDPQRALETHAREELGIDPNELGSPLAAAGSSFASFAVGAVIPLAPWFVAHGTTALLASMVLGVVAAVVVGIALSSFTGRPATRSAARQLAFTAIPAVVTFAVGHLIGRGVAA